MSGKTTTKMAAAFAVLSMLTTAGMDQRSTLKAVSILPPAQ